MGLDQSDPATLARAAEFARAGLAATKEEL
jgi:hypothetical protein